MPCPPTLASRGAGRLANKSALLEMLCCIFANLYGPDNPSGAVSLGVAENSLLHKELKAYCDGHLDLEPNDFTYGVSLKGSPRLFAALAKLYASPRFGSTWDIQPSELVLGCGVGALLDQAVSMICDRGDVVLLANPHYAGFQKDVGARNGAICMGVDLGDNSAGPASLAYFEKRIEELVEKGVKARAILLCNPQNPLGFCYPRETIIAYARFAEKHDIFLIVDEIYALSVFESDQRDAEPFHSILSFDLEKDADCDPKRIIHLYGASKDFCCNGFRIGAMVSKNVELLDGFTASAMWLKISSPADMLFSSILSNSSTLDWFVHENTTRLAAAYAFATRFLVKHHIPYLPSCAGHFVFIDLRAFLPSHDSQGKALTNDADKEAALFLSLLNNGVYIAPGAFYKYHQAGWFRLTFTVVESIMQVGLDRMAQALGLQESIESSVTPVRPRAGVEVSQVADELAELSIGCVACMC